MESVLNAHKMWFEFHFKAFLPSPVWLLKFLKRQHNSTKSLLQGNQKSLIHSIIGSWLIVLLFVELTWPLEQQYVALQIE